jgi:hypothetical protein
MKYDSGRINDASQRIAFVPIDLMDNFEMEFRKFIRQAGMRVPSLGYLQFDAKKDRSRGTDHSAVRLNLKDCGEVGIEQEIIERGQQAVQAAYFEIAGCVLAAFHRPDPVSGSVLPSIICSYRKRIAGAPCPAV